MSSVKQRIISEITKIVNELDISEIPDNKQIGFMQEVISSFNDMMYDIIKIHSDKHLFNVEFVIRDKTTLESAIEFCNLNGFEIKRHWIDGYDCHIVTITNHDNIKVMEILNKKSNPGLKLVSISKNLVSMNLIE